MSILKSISLKSPSINQANSVRNITADSFDKLRSDNNTLINQKTDYTGDDDDDDSTADNAIFLSSLAKHSC